MHRRHRAGYAQPPGPYDAGGYSPTEIYDLKEMPVVDTSPPDGIVELASGTEDVRVELDAPRKPVEMPGGEVSEMSKEGKAIEEHDTGAKEETEASTESTA